MKDERSFDRRQRHHLFLIGLILFGLELVRQAIAPLKEAPAFVDIFSQTKSPLFGIGLGMQVIVVVQASAIPISFWPEPSPILTEKKRCGAADL